MSPWIYCVVDLRCGLGPIGLLVQFMGGPGCFGEYLNPLPIPFIPTPTHAPISLYEQLMILISKVWKKPTKNPADSTGH